MANAVGERCPHLRGVCNTPLQLLAKGVHTCGVYAIRPHNCWRKVSTPAGCMQYALTTVGERCPHLSRYDTKTIIFLQFNLSTMSFSRAFIFLFSVLLTFSACKKDDDTNNDANSTADSYAKSDAAYTDTYVVVSQSADESGISGKTTEVCATITLSPNDLTTFPKTMTIDFGAGCTGTDGIFRKGKIIASVTGKLLESGSAIVCTFDNYYTDGYKVEGTYSLSNSTVGSNYSITSSVESGKITYPTGETVMWNGTRTLTQTSGQATFLNFEDDQYETTVSGSGTNVNGYNFGASTSENVRLLYTCGYPVSGVLNLTASGNSGGAFSIAASLDYGDGGCDNKATLTSGGSSKEITL